MNAQNFIFRFFYMSNRPIAQSIRAQIAVLIVALAVVLTTFFSYAWAGEGHDHGDAPAAATGTAAPRLTSHSDLFELVGMVEGNEMKIYLDCLCCNAKAQARGHLCVKCYVFISCLRLDNWRYSLF